jgi:hypothetical protein
LRLFFFAQEIVFASLESVSFKTLKLMVNTAYRSSIIAEFDIPPLEDRYIFLFYFWMVAPGTGRSRKIFAPDKGDLVTR